MDDPQATNQPGWFTRTYAYSAAIPCAVSSVTSEQSAVDSYTYDANGNPSTGSGRRMTCRIENGVVYTHAYNAENRASSIAKRNTDCTGTILESWSFAYDGDGTRVSTAHFTGTSGSPDSTTSYYMGGQFEVKDGATKKYYSIAGMMVAVNDGTAVQYLLTDHLGSTVAVTNSSGTLTSQQRYLPFGGERAIPNSPILATDFGYTGQRLLDSGMGGIMDYKARFYSPMLGRFLQPDIVIPGAASPQSWNRLSYVSNNPISYNDPTGHTRAECNEDPASCEHEPAPLPDGNGNDSGGTRCNNDPDCRNGGNDDDLGNILSKDDDSNCWVQISTENYWVNTCDPGPVVNITIEDPNELALDFYEFNSPRAFWTNTSISAVGGILAPGGPQVRLAWKIMMKALAGAGVNVLADAAGFYLLPDDYDDELAKLIRVTGNDNTTSVHLTIYQNTYTNIGHPARGAPEGFVLNIDSAVLVQATNSQEVTPFYMPSFYFSELQELIESSLSTNLP